MTETLGAHVIFDMGVQAFEKELNAFLEETPDIVNVQYAINQGAYTALVIFKKGVKE